MKYRLGGVIVEAIDTYVRVTTRSNTDSPLVRVTPRQLPTAVQVAVMLADMRGMDLGGLDAAHLTICGRAAADARDNVVVLAL